MVETAPPSPGIARMPRKRALAFTGYLALFGWWIGDGLIADTMLVTPIDGWFRGATVTLGIMLGLKLTSLLLAHHRSGHALFPAGREKLGTVLAGSVAVVWCALILDQAAWRIAEVVAFRNGGQPVTHVLFPITDHGARGGNAWVEIGGASGGRLPVSRRDLVALEAEGQLRPPWRWCLPLRRQVEGSAVRVFIPARPRPSVTRKVTAIERCPERVRHAEPW